MPHDAKWGRHTFKILYFGSSSTCYCNFIKEYFAKGVEDIVQFIPAGHGEQFVRFILKELAYPKTKLNQELRQTLVAFMNNQGDLTQTAKETYIHRNTVRYRIERIEEILGFSLRDPNGSLNVRMALLLTPQD